MAHAHRRLGLDPDAGSGGRTHRKSRNHFDVAIPDGDGDYDVDLYLPGGRSQRTWSALDATMASSLPDPYAVAVPPHALGLFGGRFDPVHRAHAAMAQATADQLGLREVHWLVTGQPVHKAASASAEDRLAMTQLALEALRDPRMVLDDREVRAARQGKESASHATVASFQAEYPGRPLVWILGEDQLASFTQWRKWQWLVQSVILAICGRPGATASASEQVLVDAGARLCPVALPPDTVSSTEIRQRVRDGQPLGKAVSPAVARYIHDHQLYLQPPGGSP